MNLLLNSGRSSRARVIFQSLNLTFQLRNVGSRPSERKKNAIVALAATTTVRLEIIFIQNQELSCCVWLGNNLWRSSIDIQVKQDLITALILIIVTTVWQALCCYFHTTYYSKWNSHWIGTARKLIKSGRGTRCCRCWLWFYLGRKSVPFPPVVL